MHFFGLKAPAGANRDFFRMRVASVLTAVVLAGSSACVPEVAHSSDDSNAPILVGHHGTEETLLAATDRRFIIARAVYPPDSEQTASPVRPTQLKLVAIDCDTGDRTPLEQLFDRPMADVPVSDGRWLLALDADMTILIADLDTGTRQSVPSDVLPQTFDTLWMLRYPWLLLGRSTDVFICNLQETQQHLDLPAETVPNSWVMDDRSVGFLVATPDGKREIRLLDLASGQSAMVATVDAAQLCLFQDQLLYITLDPSDDAYYVRSYKAGSAETPIVLRLRQVPKPNETQSITEKGIRGYLILHQHPNGIYIPLIDMDILHDGGDREFVAQYGVLTENLIVRNQPRFAGNDHLVFRDTNDGFWVIDNLETLASRRVNPFPANP